MQKGFYPVGEVFFALCKTVDTPLSLGAWLRFKHLCFDDLATLEIDPRGYTSASSFRDDYLIVSFLRKWKGLGTTFNLEKEALSSFASSEARCKLTNKRLRNFSNVPPGTLHEVFHLAQRKIAKLLGPFSMFAVSESYGWGPGATVCIPRSRAFLDTKMSELPITVSRRSRAMLRDTIEADRNWLECILGIMPDGPVCLLPEVFEVVDHCKVTTVPKSAKTDRTIAIEPRGNAFLQKGFGGYLRDRLRRVGQDLSDQSRNQKLAAEAYFQRLATLDLKAASDTVSTELVYQLLPYEWASAMDSLRSHHAYMPDGSLVKLEKFSSMGNGFTFELESLIFWALAQSVSDLGSRGVVSIYGDDLIVDRIDVPVLKSVLEFSGFELNEAKSFVEGDFFESCGKHYFQGEDVTPVYQKELVSANDLSVIRLGNRIIRYALRQGIDRGVIDKRFESAWRASRRFAGRTSQFFMPVTEEGDEAWALPISEFERIRIGHGQLCCKVARASMRRLPAYGTALYAWSLRRGPVRTPDKFLKNFFYSDGAFSIPGENHDMVQLCSRWVAEDVEDYGNSSREKLDAFTCSERWVSIPPGFSYLTFGQ